MQPMAVCPNCRVLLQPLGGEPNVLLCEKCRGRFLRNQTSLESVPEQLVKVGEDGIDPIACPDCLSPMDVIENEPNQRFLCAACHGVWIDATATEVIATPTTELIAVDAPVEASSFINSILYGVSLPERIVRTAVGVTAGSAREAAKLLIPVSFQSSKSYEVAVKNSLDFLTETVGGFESETSEAADAGEHIAKKAVGNFVDIAGMAALHVSPMWVMAAVSDIAYGSNEYIKEVAIELEKQGIIDEASTIHNVDEFLAAIQNTSGKVASSIDKPPLSVDEFRAFVRETRATVSNADIRKVLPENEIRQYWSSLNEVARKEHITMFEAATAVAMHTAQQTSNVAVGATTGFRVAGGLLHRNVIRHYQDSLKTINERGFLVVLRETYAPFAGFIWNNFSGKRRSWTESLIDASQVTKIFGFSKPNSSS